MSTHYFALEKAARALLAACDMDEHNQAISYGKKGKAWNGEFVRKSRIEAMARVRALTPDIYRCTKCGTRWRLNPSAMAQPDGSWSLAEFPSTAGKCCDNSDDFLSNIVPVLSV